MIHRVQKQMFLSWVPVNDFKSKKEAKKAIKELEKFSGNRFRILSIKP